MKILIKIHNKNSKKWQNGKADCLHNTVLHWITEHMVINTEFDCVTLLTMFPNRFLLYIHFFTVPCLFPLGFSVRSHMELPYYAKYLLIAAYLASYNPANTDRRFFTKQGRKGLSNRAKAAAKAKKSNTQLTG